MPSLPVNLPDAAKRHLPFAMPAPGASRKPSRVVLIACSDRSQRERLGASLQGLRWEVLEVQSGAAAWDASRDSDQLEALLIDPWLPDLEIAEFLKEFHEEHPTVSLILTDGTSVKESPRSCYQQELLYALRQCQDANTATWQSTTFVETDSDPARLSEGEYRSVASGRMETFKSTGLPVRQTDIERASDIKGDLGGKSRRVTNVDRIPELVGTGASMLEVSRRIRLVAGRLTPVLIEGPTGSGKELVAEALHRLSTRARKPLVAINCAAIPEALLEAELFGHTRGAFTGAVQGRTGRIESADGGTLFLDEIGEMPLALQSKLLRFVESGELQRIGDNETVKVDVRILAATHQPLAEHAQTGSFRSDLYYRLAVFLIRTPALAEHLEDLPLLVAHFLEKMGRSNPVKRLDPSAMGKLSAHGWPGNVRELEHVLERAAILAGDEPVISDEEIDFGLFSIN